jgi:hypothetical protein
MSLFRLADGKIVEDKPTYNSRELLFKELQPFSHAPQARRPSPAE